MLRYSKSAYDFGVGAALAFDAMGIKGSEYLGRAAVEKRHEQEALKQAIWTLKNMPSLLDEEQKALLQKHGKLKDA